MTRRVKVFHGTSAAFKGIVDENGLIARPGTLGVRVALQKRQARDEAKAFATYVMAQEQLPPRCMIVSAIVRRDRITERKGRLVVAKLERAEISFEEFDANELFDPEVAAKYWDLYAMLTDEKNTLPTPVAGARRS